MDPTFIQHCSACKEEFAPHLMVNRCTKCGGLMTVSYDFSRIQQTLTRQNLMSRESGLWRYRELLPISDSRHVVSFNEGGTPLVPSRKVAPSYGLSHVYFKDETRLPTGSLKDRCATVSISKAYESGEKSVVVASSGNGASSMAAYSARAGIDCYVFVSQDAAVNKLVQSMTYGAKVVKVGGTAGNAVEMAVRVGKQKSWPNVSTAAVYNPYSLQGQKTGAYEVAEQLGWEVPDWVVIPVGSGNCIAAQWAGFNDLLKLGLVHRRPRLAAVQSTGCAPFTDAVRRGLEVSEVRPWDNPNTIAGGVRDEYPYDLELALPALRESAGAAVTVTDSEIVDAIGFLGKGEGLFVEPTGAVATAGLKQLVKERIIDKNEVVVTMLTGSGLKDPKQIGERMTDPPTVEPGADFASLFR